MTPTDLKKTSIRYTAVKYIMGTILNHQFLVADVFNS